ncbi:hypothetical protein DXV76_18760 [Rhodobacteraceae bacterium CCMM004]|nr:hypothetical protein DXV76_18760 [Rhodobacteraceae bacterium CCMM004]
MRPVRVSHEIFVAAPPETVWRVTADVAGWADWSPTITAVSGWAGGPLVEDARLDLKQPLQRKRSWVVLRCAAPRSLLLRTAEGDMTAVHEIAEMPRGTRNRLTLVRCGPFGGLVAPALRMALRMENAALKRRCEALSENARGP